jgi:hypothetical protein
MDRMYEGGMAEAGGLLGEYFIDVLRPVNLESILRLNIKIVDVLDKGKNTLCICQSRWTWLKSVFRVSRLNFIGLHALKTSFSVFVSVNGRDEEGLVFRSESHFFEVGTGGFGGQSQSRESCTEIRLPPTETPDQILQFQAVQPSEWRVKKWALLTWSVKSTTRIILDSIFRLKKKYPQHQSASVMDGTIWA